MTRSTRGWFTAAALLTFTSVVMGAVVCATESGASCPNWPGCYPDQFTPAARLSPLIEFTHRVVAAATGPAVLLAALLGRRLVDSRPRRLAWVGLAGTVAAGVFGMLTVKVGIPWWLGVVDLASALTATVAMLVARLLLTPGRVWAPAGGRAAWAAVGTLAVVHLTGLAVAGPGSFTRCLSWPLGILEADRWPLLQAARLVLTAVAMALVALATARAARRPDLRPYGWLAAGTVVVELVLGGVLLSGAGGGGVRTAYAVAAAAVFGAVALLAARASLPVPATAEGPLEPALPGRLTPE